MANLTNGFASFQCARLMHIEKVHMQASGLPSLCFRRCAQFDNSSGVAGLRYALEVSKYSSIAIITKAEPHESNTNYAQGGVSVVLCPSDSVESHMKDTIVAGAYLCDEEIARAQQTQLLLRNLKLLYKELLYKEYLGVEIGVERIGSSIQFVRSTATLCISALAYCEDDMSIFNL